MRVLIATDAWHPQVNGVVRTLTSLAEAAKSLGVSIEFLTHEGFPTIPLPTYANLRLAIPGRRRDRTAHRGGKSRRHPHRDRGADRVCRARLLPAARAAVHHELHHVLSGIHRGARTDPGVVELCGAAPLPRRRNGDDGFHHFADEPAAQPWIPEPQHVDARRRHRPVCAASRDPARPAAADLPHRGTGCGRKEPGSVSFARSARIEGRDRRRPAGSRTAAALSGCDVPRTAQGRGARRTDGGRGRVRVSEPDRHIRRRAARGARLRRAGRGLSRSWGRAMSSAAARSACSTRTCAPLASAR